MKHQILELCSESEYGSWEFWPTDQEKTPEVAEIIINALIDLVNERMIFPVEYSAITDKSYKEVPLDSTRLRNEINRSITNDVDSNNFYWFLATEEGKKADAVVRSQE